MRAAHPTIYSVRLLILLGGLLDRWLEVSHILREEVDGAEDLLFLRIRAIGELILELLDGALDQATSTCRGVWGQPEDVALGLEELVDLLQPDVILHDWAELLQGGLLHDGRDAREALSHDGNEQVHEDQGNDDGSQDEHDPDNLGVFWRVGVLVEVTQAHEISVDHGIKWCNANQALIEGFTTLLLPVDVEQEDDVGESAESNNEHDKEDLDVLDDFGDHSDESTEWLEETHPVEEFEPHHEDGNWSKYLELLVWNRIGDLAENIHAVEAKRTNIDQVPDIKEITDASILDLDHLKNEERDEGLSEDD